MTKQEAIRLHREIWSWCAKTGKDKEEWPEWEWNGGKYNDNFIGNSCFLCEYLFGHIGFDPYEKDICEKKCPLKWPGGRCCQISMVGNKPLLFDLWNRETDIEKRKEYAEQIALLDER